MKLVLTIWISVVLIQEVHSNTLVRLRRHPLTSPSVVHTEYEAKYEQKGNHGNDSFGKVCGKQEILHDNCSEDWNAFADKCACLIKDLVASLANAVSSKPGDATQLQLQIKNTFKHFDNTHNCTCNDNAEKALSNVDWSPILSNVTIKTVQPTYSDGSSDCGGDCESDKKKNVVLVEPVSIVGDSGSEPCDSCGENKQTGNGDQILVLEPTGTTKQIKHSNRAFIDVPSPECENSNEDSCNSRREIHYPQVSVQKPQSLSKTAGKRIPVLTITPMKQISNPETVQEQECDEDTPNPSESFSPETSTSEDCDTDQDSTKPTVAIKSEATYVYPSKNSVINSNSNFPESLGHGTTLETVNPNPLPQTPVIQVEGIQNPEEDCDETEQPSISVVNAVPSAPIAESHQLASVPIQEEPVSIHTIKPLPLVSEPSPGISQVEEDCDEEKPTAGVLVPMVASTKDECDDCEEKKPVKKEIAISVVQSSKDECDDCDDKKKPKAIAIPVVKSSKDECDDCEEKKPKVKQIAIPVMEKSKDDCDDCEEKKHHHKLPDLHEMLHQKHHHLPDLHELHHHKEKPKMKEIAIPVMETKDECDDCDDKKKPKAIAIPVVESSKDECDDCEEKKPKVKQIAIPVMEKSKDECDDCEEKKHHHKLPDLHELLHQKHHHLPDLHEMLHHKEKPKMKEIAIPVMETKDECDDCDDKKKPKAIAIPVMESKKDECDDCEEKKPKMKQIAIPVMEKSKDECDDCEEKKHHHGLPDLHELLHQKHHHLPDLHELHHHKEKPKMKEIAIPVMETKDECNDCDDKKKPKGIAIAVVDTSKDECDDCDDKKKPKAIAIPVMESKKDECDDCEEKKPKIKQIAIPVMEKPKDECDDCEEKKHHHGLPDLHELLHQKHHHLPDLHELHHHKEKPKMKEIAIPVIESTKDECDDCDDKKKPKGIALAVVGSSKDECDDCDDKKKPKAIAIPVMESSKDECDDCEEKKPKVKQIAIPVMEKSKDDCDDCEEKKHHHKLPDLHELLHQKHHHLQDLHDMLHHKEKPKMKEIAIPVMSSTKDECDDCDDKKPKAIAIPVVESSKDECDDCEEKKPKVTQIAIPVMEKSKDECDDCEEKTHHHKLPDLHELLHHKHPHLPDLHEMHHHKEKPKVKEIAIPVIESSKDECDDCDDKKKPKAIAIPVVKSSKDECDDCDDKKVEIAAAPVEEDCEEPKNTKIREIVVPVAEVSKDDCKDCDKEMKHHGLPQLSHPQPIHMHPHKVKEVAIPVIAKSKDECDDCDDKKQVVVAPVEEECDDQQVAGVAIPVVETKDECSDCGDKKEPVIIAPVEEDCDDPKVSGVAIPVIEAPKDDCKDCGDKKEQVIVAPVEEECDDPKVSGVAIPVVETAKEDCKDCGKPVVEEECDDEKAIPVVPVVEVKKPEEDCADTDVVVQPTTFQTTSVQPTRIPLAHEAVIPLTSPKTMLVPDEEDDDDEDCCSCESCTEEDTTDLKQYKENACRNLEEAKRELKAIFEKIRKKLKCGRKTHTIITT